MPCKRNTCLVCVRSKVRQITCAMHIVRPSWWLTLDRVGATWREASVTMTRFRRRRRERWGLEIEDAYFLEPYRNGGLHAHVWATGDMPDPERLYDAALDSSTRVGALDAVRHHGGLGYALKDTRTRTGLESYLTANNGTLVHATRGFWKRPGGSPVVGGYRALAATL